MATYGTSANGTEGDPARINVINANWFTTLSSTRLNEFHVTYSRESRPRSAVPSNIPADTAMGFGPTFRFGNPYFLQPGVDELAWRTQIKDNVSWIRGGHTIKVGGEWMHTLNDQVFRGFFTGRYIFDSVTGFLRYASPAAPAASVRTPSAVPVACTSPRRQRAQAAERRPADRCCSICRARAAPAWRPTRPARRRFPTRSSPSSFRTSGRWGRG